MATLMRASTEWSKRPADQRYASLTDLHAAVQRYHQVAREATVPYASLRARVVDGQVQLNGRTETTATLTHWSFGQLAQRAGAPASYLREIPADLAAQCINHGLETRVADHGDDDQALVLFAKNEPAKVPGLFFDPPAAAPSYTCRSFTSPKYTRIWNDDITKRLLAIQERGPWQPAPAAFDGSRGLYASDRDMFAFMVDSDRRIFETLPGGGLSRGFFVWNSEVGDSTFGIMTFLYEYCCGNHRVWGATGVKELRLRHVGNADERAFRGITAELRTYAESSASDLEAQIQSARTYVLGKDKDAVLDAVFGLRLPQLSRKRIGEAFDLAETRRDWYGAPTTAWGLAGGLTEIARDLPHANERVALDRAAGRVMQIAF